MQKPYIPNPESNDRDLKDLALECWCNSLRRDWSFIFFMFYGQMRSILQCLTCENKSVTFDVFTNIPLSLPEPSKLILNIVVHRLPSAVKSMLDAKEGESVLNQTLIGDQVQELFERNYSKLANDQPIHIMLHVSKSILISELAQ